MDEQVKSVVVSYAIQHGGDEVDRQEVRTAVQRLIEGTDPGDLNAEALEIAHDDLGVFYHLLDERCEDVLEALDGLITRIGEWRRRQ